MYGHICVYVGVWTHSERGRDISELKKLSQCKWQIKRLKISEITYKPFRRAFRLSADNSKAVTGKEGNEIVLPTFSEKSPSALNSIHVPISLKNDVTENAPSSPKACSFSWARRLFSTYLLEIRWNHVSEFWSMKCKQSLFVPLPAITRGWVIRHYSFYPAAFMKGRTWKS